MKFTLNRDYTLNSLFGHCVEFFKDVATFVPPMLHKEALALGAVPETALPDAPVETDMAPKDPETRYQKIKEAVEGVTLKNVREDFNAGGTPHTGALSRWLGWSPTVQERDNAIARMKDPNEDVPPSPAVPQVGPEVVALSAADIPKAE